MLRLPDSSRLGQSTRPSEALSLQASPPGSRFVGLDAESLWFGDEGLLPWQRLAFSFAWGEQDGRVSIITAEGYNAGIFRASDLEKVRADLVQPDVVVVAHNANYDLDLLNGTLDFHGLDPLPPMRYADTMGVLKNGKVGRRTLDDLCWRFLGRRKAEHPDWRAVLQRSPEAWDRMISYNIQDVRDTLALRAARRPEDVPIKTWEPRKR